MTKLRKVLILSGIIALLGLGASTFAQTTTVLKGTVTDQNGAVVPNAKVTLSSASKSVSQTAQTTGDGGFSFRGLEPGDDYIVTIEAQGFGKVVLSNVKTQVGSDTDLSPSLKPGSVGVSIDVTAGGAELLNTTDSNISQGFNSRQAVDLAATSIGSGINNLALLAANVTTSGGVGVGTGGSVGGERARDNNFVVDGIDNNDKSVTGPQAYISPEEVQEFTLISNQTPAEYARSNGGQFITVTKSGGKDYHGTFYGFIQNRNLNAGASDRYDRFRGGFNFGGPVPAVFSQMQHGDDPHWGQKSDKLFFFGSYERLQNGLGAAALPIFAPTANGRTILAGIAGLSNNNRNVFLQYMPVAPTNNGGNVIVNGVAVPVGLASITAPNFFKQNHAIGNIDFNQSSKTIHRWRFSMTNLAEIDAAANLPQFFIALPLKQRLFSYTIIHNFSSTFIDEMRFGFRRSSNNFPAGNLQYPGLSMFPNIQVDELGVNIGPDPNAPQFTIENNYQIVDNFTWIH
ncbi:MAG: carboxypeptidase regulatory-like domain-containing protein, partial [Acidobacteriales bacterium]|nr:carboxypeptidase regulatory-like domain-containing protein [Terriglobales bacterium]